MKYIWILMVLVFSTGCSVASDYERTEDVSLNEPKVLEEVETIFAFEKDRLSTNTEKALIDLSEVLDGGPGKDGIPALTNPAYVSVEQASGWYTDESQGILVDINGEKKWFSYDVLYWHEIVNDIVGGKPVTVTFCPLCGSAIVFDAFVEDRVLDFGVSGKLWQSNLLMYDRETESLWSQIEGAAKVGDLAGTVLNVVDSQVISWGEVKNREDLKVLSHDTGYVRDYGRTPYGTYESDTSLYFPVNTVNDKLHPKALLIAGTYQNQAFALERFPFIEQGRVELVLGGNTLLATYEDGMVFVQDQNGESIPTFNTMWFSWANHWLDEKAVVWFGPKEDESQPEGEEIKQSLRGTIQEYFSYGCFYCEQVHTTLDAVLEQSPETAIELKHFIVYDAFLPIHEGQVCADQQGIGYEFHDRYFRDYYPEKDPAVARSIVESIDGDIALYESCLASELPQDIIRADMRDGYQIGVQGTPTILYQDKDGLRPIRSRDVEGILSEIR